MRQFRLFNLFSALISFVLTWFFIGISADREFGDKSFFLKKTPNLKVKYYSPLGESDASLQDLSPDLQKEEMAQAQVEEPPRSLDIIAGFLIQSTFSLIILYLMKVFRFIKFLQHFIITTFITMFFLQLCINARNPVMCLLWLAVTIALNFLIYYFISGRLKLPKSIKT
jgi:hypothetical protein